MYSVVLMMAMTTAPESESFFFRHCHGYSAPAYAGCYGCYGFAYGGYAYPHWGGYAYPYWSSYGYIPARYYYYPPAYMPLYPPLAATQAPAIPVVSQKTVGTVAAPAHITVNLPADAKIFIEGTETPSTTDRRVFVTPELKPGAVYYYTIEAEVVRDGKKLRATEKIAVEAGSHAKIQLKPNEVGSVASK